VTDGEKTAATIASRLARHLGPNIARIAITTFSQKALGIPAEEAQPFQIPKLIEALRPMLNVMLGKDHAEAVIGEIRRDLSIAV
jgi:hypothetical protein